MPSGEMMKLKRVVTAAYLIIPLSTGCTSDSQALHGYILANYHQFGQNGTQSQKLYEQLLSSNVSHSIYKGYVPFLHANRNYKEIVQLMPTIDKHYQDDIEIQHHLAQSLIQTGNKSLGIQKLSHLNKKFPENQEIAFELIKLHLEQNSYQQANSVIDSLLNTSARKPNNFIFYFLKSQIAVQLGDKKEALKYVRTCLELYPKFDKGWLMYATLKEQAGNLQEAIKGYTNFLETTVDHRDRHLEKHLLELVLKKQVNLQKKPDLAISQADLKTILSLLDSKNYLGAVNRFESCLTDSCQNHKKQLVALQTLVDNKKTDQAFQSLQKLLNQEPNQKLWYDVLHLLCAHDVPYKNGIGLLEGIIKKNPSSLLAHLYLIDLLIRDGQETKTIELLEKAVNLTTSKQLKTILYTQLATVAYQKKQLTVFKNALASGLQLNVAYAPLYNLEAYYYLRIDRNAKKALARVGKALQLEPNNINFKDTQAYIYYKQKDFEKAGAIWKELAESIGKENYVIQKHIAKLNHQRGNIKDAILILKKAIPLAKTTEQKKETTALIKRWSTHST